MPKTEENSVDQPDWRSRNFVPGQTGWAIWSDGRAEFNQIIEPLGINLNARRANDV